MIGSASLRETLASLPPVWPEDPLPSIRKLARAGGRSVVVLDDDPTGTQTVYDVPVLTKWSSAVLEAELARATPVFYLLTNSRSLPSEDAARLARNVGSNLRGAARRAARDIVLVSRSDSTLRGHYPAEVDALLEATQHAGAARILVPFFEEGGRYTIGDVHYVAEGDQLVPVAETPFARDASFGFRNSNLRGWVAEKSGGGVLADDVVSVSLSDLRRGGPQALSERLAALSPGSVCVVNAAAMRDVEVLALGSLMAEARGCRFLFRSAASFVRARAGLEGRPLLPAVRPRPGSHGGLIVVGSHVPKTTEQLDRLLRESRIAPVELSVGAVLKAGGRASEVHDASSEVDRRLRAGEDVVLTTSRSLVLGASERESLGIAARVSASLVEIVRRLTASPSFIVAKGGITSSDIATRALGIERAMVRGQILPGVPVWRLGDEARFPGLDYVVFPGNVGGPTALLDLWARLTGTTS